MDKRQLHWIRKAIHVSDLCYQDLILGFVSNRLSSSIKSWRIVWGKLLVTCFFFTVLLSCGNNSIPEHANDGLNVAVAANVQFAIQPIIKAFEKKYSIPTKIIVSSSGKHTATIMQGAPYDIFLSANMKYPDTLFQTRWAVKAPLIYAKGKLVFWTFQELEGNNPNDWLVSEEVKKIAVANPRNAPYGEQAIQYLKNKGLYERVKSKLIYGESIAQTNQYITSGACEIGLTAQSVVLAPKWKGKGSWSSLDTTAYVTILQGAVITSYGEKHHFQQAELFMGFLQSSESKQILREYGYLVD